MREKRGARPRFRVEVIRLVLPFRSAGDRFADFGGDAHTDIALRLRALGTFGGYTPGRSRRRPAGRWKRERGGWRGLHPRPFLLLAQETGEQGALKVLR